MLKALRKKLLNPVLSQQDAILQKCDEILSLNHNDIRQKILYEIRQSVSNGLTLTKEKMPDCKLLPCREDALNLLPKGGTMAEIGVAFGSFSRKIIDKLQPSQFFAIDGYFWKQGDDTPWGNTTLQESNMNQREYIEHQFKQEIKNGLFFVKQGWSWDVLETFDDGYFDYAYLDASHDYESVKKDITVLLKKMKNHGIIQFNDYTLFDWYAGYSYGVVKAVDELLMSGNHKMLYFCLSPSGFHDVVVQLNKS